MTRRPTMNRRQFAKALGATALLAPFMTGRPAFAQAAKKAKYLFIMATPNGTIPSRLGTVGTGRDYSLEAGSILEPLAARRDDITLFRGLDFLEASNHEGGMRAMLTGMGDTSIDQHIAAAIGKESAFSSLELGVMTSNWGANVQTRMIYNGGDFVHPDDAPASVYRRLFGSVTGNMEEVEYNLVDRRRSILDLASEEIAEVDRKVARCGGRAEQEKLQAHLSSIRTLEDRLMKQAAGGGAAMGGGCNPPTVATVSPSSNDSFPEIGQSQMDLGVAALACGLTNVVTLQWAHTVSPVTFTWLGQSTGHHDLSHAMNQDYVDAERWFAERFVGLLDQLANTDDPVDEGSLLDHTVVLWTQELGHGSNHVCKDVPFVLAGAPSVLDHGQLLSFNGESHQRLLVSLLESFGLPGRTFGRPMHTPGSLDGVLKA
jgi:hypothetical protein